MEVTLSKKQTERLKWRLQTQGKKNLNTVQNDLLTEGSKYTKRAPG